jgi:ribosomal protein S15P/S13E
MTEKWYTYPAAAEALGVKVQAVQKRVRRNGWAKRVNNETGQTEVQFDLEAVGRRAVQQVVRTSSNTSTPDAALIAENNSLKVQLAALTEKSSQLEQRIDELKVDQKEKREIIEGLLQVLQDQSPPPSKGLFGWLLGR